MFALIMPNVGKYNLVLVAHKLVVSDIGRYEDVGMTAQGAIYEKTAGSAANSHTLHIAADVAAVSDGFNAERALNRGQEVASGDGLWQIAHYANAMRRALAAVIGLQESDISESHLSCDMVVHSSEGTIHVGMRAIDVDVVLDGLSHNSLHVIATGDFLERVEDERVVRDYEIALPPDSLCHDVGCDIGAEKYAGDGGLWVTHL